MEGVPLPLELFFKLFDTYRRLPVNSSQGFTKRHGFPQADAGRDLKTHRNDED